MDWLEAGTPLLLAEGLHAVEGLRRRFPDHPIVADLKTMDGGYLEAEMMAKAGADLVVVMGRAHEATIRRVVDAARDFGIKVMGDNLAADDRVANAMWMECLGVDFIVHHIGFDERGLIKGLSPLDELDEVVRAVSIPVQAVGGLSIEQAIECARRGAPLVVVGAPLVIDGAAFKPGRPRTVPGPAAHLLGRSRQGDPRPRAEVRQAGLVGGAQSCRILLCAVERRQRDRDRDAVGRDFSPKLMEMPMENRRVS